MGVCQETFTFQSKNKGKNVCKVNTRNFTISEGTIISYFAIGQEKTIVLQ